MRIADYAAPDLISVDLAADGKEELLAQMVGMLVRGQRVTDPDALMQELLKRERVMSTGIGGGIAIPHALTNDIEHLVIVFGRMQQMTDFQALDGQPVELVFMLVGPKTGANLYVKLLARISRLLQNENFKSRLRAAQSADEILDVFRTEEEPAT